MKAVITVTCPDCGGVLEIDVAREKVLSHREKLDVENAKDKDALFDDVVKRVATRPSETEKKFEAARAAEEKKSDRLEDLFDDVKKKVAEEKKKPYDPDDDPRKLFWD